MQQKSGDRWRPLGFFSRKLKESCYSTFDCELLATQTAIKLFRHFCEGCLFQLWTDHKPLLPPFLVFQYQFPPNNSATSLVFQSLMYSCCIYLV